MAIKFSVEEDQGRSQPNYVHITDKYAEILMAILELETEEATPPIIERKYKYSPNTVNDFVAKMSQDSRQFLSTMEWSGGKGAHSVLLEIRPNKLATNPISAFILIELAKISKETRSREIDRKQFIEQLNKAFANSSKFKNIQIDDIESRINFLIKIGDICQDDTVDNIIWIDLIRYHSQKTYLTRLLKKFLEQPLNE